MNITKNFSKSPVPKSSIKSGTIAGTGKYLIKLLKGVYNLSHFLENPIKTPIGIENKLAIKNPINIR